MKKKILSVVIMFFLAVSLVLTGCKDRGLPDNPKTDALTISNGGTTVVKGDYLYFVNGYVDETGLTKDDNKEGTVTRGAIYRTKLDNSEIVKDKDGFLDDDRTDLVVSRVVGFSNGGFYIIDDTIYYATPYMMLDKDGNLLNDRVEIRSININGDTKTDKQVYVTETHMDNLDWTMYKVDGEVYLLTYCNNYIYSVKASNGEVVAKIEKSSSYAFYHEDNYSTSKDRSGNKFRYVYYTRAAVESDRVSANYTGNVLCAFDITNGKVTSALNTVNNDTLNVLKVEGNYLYYTRTKNTSQIYLYRQDTRAAFNNNAEDMTNGVAYSTYYPCAFGDYVIATNDNGTWLVSHGNTPVRISTEAISIFNVYGGYAYYLSSDVLYRFKVTDSADKEAVAKGEKTLKATTANLIDFDNQRLYVFASYNDNYYMDYVDDTRDTQRFVGVFADGETPEAPEQKEGYGEDPDIEYIPHID